MIRLKNKLVKALLHSTSTTRRTLISSSSGSRSHPLIANNLLTISDELRSGDGQMPVVALESTIITHGLPYPTNLETALEVEEVVRAHGAVPATIGLLGGQLKVGLSRAEIEHLAKSHRQAIKLSRRDLAFVLGNKQLLGGTTVSTTCIGAHAANIPIFCTGGIGGVHRDYADTMDCSADLQELARTPVAVVSSGIKSILDIAKTLEYLETMGVCVVTLAESGSKSFPAFFTSSSGYDAAYNCRDERQAAQLIHTNSLTGLGSGLLIGVPIPDEHSLDADSIERTIREALGQLKHNGVRGKQVTPFLLERINQLTKGTSLRSNTALIKNNAKYSARIAVELSKLRKASHAQPSCAVSSPRVDNNKAVDGQRVTVIGGINLDNIYKLKEDKVAGVRGVTQPSEFVHTNPFYIT